MISTYLLCSHLTLPLLHLLHVPPNIIQFFLPALLLPLPTSFRNLILKKRQQIQKRYRIASEGCQDTP